jgi:hypothetical protein
MTAHEGAAARLRRCDRQVILRAAALCDGHSILKPEALVEAGLPADVVEHLTATYRSDGTPKGTLFVQGQPVAELRGVYGLHALRFLAAALDAEYRPALGRGFEAANIQDALRRRFTPAPSSPPPPQQQPS